jgi:hypothetical protein
MNDESSPLSVLKDETCEDPKQEYGALKRSVKAPPTQRCRAGRPSCGRDSSSVPKTRRIASPIGLHAPLGAATCWLLVIRRRRFS